MAKDQREVVAKLHICFPLCLFVSIAFAVLGLSLYSYLFCFVIIIKIRSHRFTNKARCLFLETLLLRCWPCCPFFWGREKVALLAWLLRCHFLFVVCFLFLFLFFSFKMQMHKGQHREKFVSQFHFIVFTFARCALAQQEVLPFCPSATCALRTKAS